MKRTMTATGLLTLVAMLAIGVFGTGSASAGGSPSSVFLWTGPLPGLVLVLSDNPQVFSFTAETGIECQHFRGHAIASNGKAMTAKEIILNGNYTSCTFLGILAAQISPVQYLLSPDGSLALNKPIVITIPEFGCSLKINSGPPNNNLRLVLYLNLAQDVLAHVEVSKIASLSSGGECGAAGEEKTELRYRGLWLISVHGGTIRWEK